eukprot:3783504-Alexandrium_andersonii.AAC.1
MPKGQVLEELKLQLEHQELCRHWHQRASQELREEQRLNEEAETNEREAEHGGREDAHAVAVRCGAV